jgi:hypothetical protein
MDKGFLISINKADETSMCSLLPGLALAVQFALLLDGINVAPMVVADQAEVVGRRVRFGHVVHQQQIIHTIVIVILVIVANVEAENGHLGGLPLPGGFLHLWWKLIRIAENCRLLYIYIFY